MPLGSARQTFPSGQTPPVFVEQKQAGTPSPSATQTWPASHPLLSLIEQPAQAATPLSSATHVCPSLHPLSFSVEQAAHAVSPSLFSTQIRPLLHVESSPSVQAPSSPQLATPPTIGAAAIKGKT